MTERSSTDNVDEATHFGAILRDEAARLRKLADELDQPSPLTGGDDNWQRELIDREPDHGQYGHAGVDTMERLRQYAAYGDTAKGRIMAQLALTEIERLNGAAQPTQLCSCKASQRDGRHMEWCPSLSSTDEQTP